MVNSAFSQDVKNEVEKRIKRKEMPAEAIQTLKTMPINLNESKFYLEKDNKHSSFEAKVKYKDHRYSIELNKKGELLDIEVVINLEEIPEEVRETIENYLENTYERHKIEKIQEHFIPANTQDAFDERKNPDKYELIVATKNKENKLEKREILFNSNGKELETRKVIRRAYEFLLF
jgi:hypothetical protein